MKRILVLPAGMPAAVNFTRLNRDRFELLGASSNRFEPAAMEYSCCFYLPHVSETTFAASLERILVENNVKSIFCAHQVVWSLIANEIASRLGVELINAAPIPAMLKPYQFAMTEADRLRQHAHLFDKKLNLPSLIALAALYRQFMEIPGECDRDKLLLFLIAFATAPAGDVIEIGSLWGKSAYVLAWLSQFYSVGSVLCIDPWSQQELIQSSPDNQLVRLSTATHDINQGFLVFCQNLLAAGFRDVNYRRELSTEASRFYACNRRVSSPEFGTTEYIGSVSVAHIDGNHDVDAVRQDVADWGPRVLPGGWLIIDDYTWKFGDGPRRVGDECLTGQLARWDCAFVMGGALALKRSKS